MVIQGHDRVAQVLDRDPRLVDEFVRTSPAFERLRNPMLRRTMARIVTVEQAARIAGVEPALLIERLNRVVQGSGTDDAPAASGTRVDDNSSSTGKTMSSQLAEPMPAAIRDVAADRLIDLDVRDDLRSGREPFSRIMGARRSLRPGEVLRLRAIFEPVPLYQVMARQGLDHWTERLADDDWRVWFFASDGVAADPSAPEPTGCGGCGKPAAAQPAAGSAAEDDVVVLDVRGLEPPEPMARTLAALDELPPSKTLVQINVRVPQFLLPQLEERGFVWEVREQSEDLVRLFIRRRES
jgi:uncharacterized protein (DUF2249 family)